MGVTPIRQLIAPLTTRDSVADADSAAHNASVADAERAAGDASAAVAERTAGKGSAAVAERAPRATACLATPEASSPTVFTSMVVDSVSDAAVEGTAGDPALEASTTAVKRATTNVCAAHLWRDDVADQSVFSAVSTVLTPMLLQRSTRLRSAWLWLLSELRRPSCNALVLGPPLDMCATSTHGPDSLVSTADVRVAELAFALAFMCIALAPSAVGFCLSNMLGVTRATSAGGHASQGCGATSSAIIKVKALLSAIQSLVVMPVLLVAAFTVAFTLLRAQAVVIVITPDVLIASLCTTLASWSSARDMGVRILGDLIFAVGPHQRSLDLVMLNAYFLMIVHTIVALERFNSMCIRQVATHVMACFDLAYERFDVTARRAAIAASAAAAERVEHAVAIELTAQRAAFDASAAAAQRVECAAATALAQFTNGAAAQHAAAEAASARLARLFADGAAAQQIATEAAIATIVRSA